MIDIIIPGYNCRKTLASCLDSICCQSCAKKLNVVFVDDCSEDDFANVLESYSVILNIKYLKSDINRGPGYCRQLGLNNSSSEFVMFMDADDLIADEDSLSVLLEAIKNSCDYVSSLVYNESLDVVLDNPGDLHGKIYRRSFLKKNKIEFTESRLHEDNLFNSLVLLNNPRKEHISRVTYLYLDLSGSLSNSISLYSETSLKEYVKNISFVKAHFSDSGDNSALADYLDAKYSYLKAIYESADEDSRKLLTDLTESYGLKPLK